MRRLPTSRDYREVAELVRNYVGDERILLFGIDTGGKKVLDLGLKSALHEVGVKNDYGFLRQADGPIRNGEKVGYRPIEGMVLDPNLKYSRIFPINSIGKRDVKYLGLVDDDIHFGESLSGAILYLLQNREKIGYEKVFSIVDIDTLYKTANFARKRTKVSGVSTLDEIMADVLSPEEYEKLKNYGYPSVIEDSIFKHATVFDNLKDLLRLGIRRGEEYFNEHLNKIKTPLIQKPTEKRLERGMGKLKRLEKIVTLL